jgi:hypothetical protein
MGHPLVSGHDLIDRQQVNILGMVHMLTKEHPKQYRPRDRCGAKAFHCTLTAPFRAHRQRPNIVTRPVMTSMA